MIRRRHAALSHYYQNKEGPWDFHIPAVFNVFCIIGIGLVAVLAFDMSIATTLTSAQEISLNDDDSICGCSAPTYTISLDLSLSCPPTNITIGQGISTVSCLISPFGAPTDKLAPVVVDIVSIIELDQFNSVLVEERIDGELIDGDSFEYSSIINNQEDMINTQNIPKSLQLTLSGRNEDGVILMNVFVITFTNECGATPVIQAGESAGWAVFSQVSGPIPRFCPTKAPSTTPSDTPTVNPTQQPTQQPSRFPTLFPTQNPTNSPTSQPTMLPTDEPTQKPTSPPTQKPTETLTVPPTRLQTDEPSQGPSEMPTELPTQKPIFEATTQPSTRPTGAPTQHPTTPLTQDTIDKPVSLPTELQSEEPSLCPSAIIAQSPTCKPTSEPTRLPVDEPSLVPTRSPVQKPFEDPTTQFTKGPTSKPIEATLPTQMPTTLPFHATKFPATSPTESTFPPISAYPSILQTTMSMPLQMSMSMSLVKSFEMEYSQFFEGEVDMIKEILND